jgi:hypothetical protein
MRSFFIYAALITMVEYINESLVLGVDDDGELDQALKICLTVDLHNDDDEDVEECDNTAERSPVDINDIFVIMDAGHIVYENTHEAFTGNCMHDTREELLLYLFTPWPNPQTSTHKFREASSLSCIQEEEHTDRP